jgi:hypothetical protein
MRNKQAAWNLLIFLFPEIFWKFLVFLQINRKYNTKILAMAKNMSWKER